MWLLKSPWIKIQYSTIISSMVILKVTSLLGGFKEDLGPLSSITPKAFGARWFSQFIVHAIVLYYLFSFHISNSGFILSSCGSSYFHLFFGHFSLKLGS
jgi:hypothetical protein